MVGESLSALKGGGVRMRWLEVYLLPLGAGGFQLFGQFASWELRGA